MTSNGEDDTVSLKREFDNQNSNNKVAEEDRDGKRSRLETSQPQSENASLSKKKFTSKKHLDPKVLEVRRKIQQCCASNDLGHAIEAYEEAVAAGVKIEAQSFYNLLNLCDGLDRVIHIGTPKPREDISNGEDGECIQVNDIDDDTRQRHAYRIKQHMDELKIPLNETAYTAFIRMLSRGKKFECAEQFLTEAEGISQCKPRLRLYSSLFCAYCESGQAVAALQLWTRLSKHGLLLTEKEYVGLIQCAVIVGDSSLMDRALSDLAEDVLVPSLETTRSIMAWFESPHSTTGDGMDPNTVSAIHSVELPSSDASPMGPVQCKEKSWSISHGCLVDSKTGILTTGCLVGEKLQPVTLSAATWDEMKKMNETIVLNGMLDNDTSLYQGGGKGPKRQPHRQQGGYERRMANWNAFQQYLEKRVGESTDGSSNRLDVVIDGANVGYYKQNFANAPKHVDYHQIDWIVRHFHKLNKKVLLVLHERHFSPKLMPRWADSLVRSWETQGVLYRASAGMNDDWFWLHAALWSGRETLVLTNDEMRDHHFQMLAPRSFLRWKERHQVHFTFGAWNGKERVVELEYPDIYSRRIQRVHDGLVIPLPKRGDENRFLDGSHVAQDQEPLEETYVCIRPLHSTS